MRGAANWLACSGPVDGLERLFYHTGPGEQARGLTRTVVYGRSSTSRRTSQSQLDACRAAAAELGFEIVGEFVDENVSGLVGFQSRAGGQRLLELIQRTRVEAVLVFRLDRIARSKADLEETTRYLEHAGLELWSVADLPLPARILPGRLTEIAAFAEFERTAIKRRMQSGVLRAARVGKWIGGPVPFGYDLDAHGLLTPSSRLVAGATEADLARSIFERLAAGSSTVLESRRMNDMGVPPGRRYARAVVVMSRPLWLPSRVRAMVRNTLYVGQHQFHNSAGSVQRAVVPLVSPQLWQAAQDRLTQNNCRRSGKQHFDYLLNRLIRCATCGRGYCGAVANSKGARTPYYRCMGRSPSVEPHSGARCRARTLPAKKLEILVWNDCMNMDPGSGGALDFAAMRSIVRAKVKAIVVETLGSGYRKRALVRVAYANGLERNLEVSRSGVHDL
ncbi:MAG TPA: recombinase family protein [Candidatus Limnocylindria bacterium]